MSVDALLPSEAVLREQAYFVASGVRPLSVVGHCHQTDDDALLHVAARLERQGEANIVPFVVDHGDGVASYGYSQSRWALDLYEWAVKDPAVPQEQRHRIIGLLTCGEPPYRTGRRPRARESPQSENRPWRSEAQRRSPERPSHRAPRPA